MKISLVSWGMNFNNDSFFAKPSHLQFSILRDLLEAKGHELKLVESLPIQESDCALFYDTLGYYNKTREDYIRSAIKSGANKKSIYFALEPPVVARINREKYIRNWGKIFKHVISVQEDLAKYDSFLYFTDTIDKSSDDTSIEGEQIDFIDKKLICAISGNKKSHYKDELYSERVKAYKFFATNCDEFEFYGSGWDRNISKKLISAYKGKCDKKLDVLSRFKFAICYENMNHTNGYITEKIIDCIKAGCVPIYLGADNINKFIPPNCFINFNSFSSYDELNAYISSMTKQEHDGFITAQKQFLSSIEFEKKFTPQAYAEFVFRAITSPTEAEISKDEAIKELNKIVRFIKLRGLAKKIISKAKRILTRK